MSGGMNSTCCNCSLQASPRLGAGAGTDGEVLSDGKGSKYHLKHQGLQNLFIIAKIL